MRPGTAGVVVREMSVARRKAVSDSEARSRSSSCTLELVHACPIMVNTSISIYNASTNQSQSDSKRGRKLVRIPSSAGYAPYSICANNSLPRVASFSGAEIQKTNSNKARWKYLQSARSQVHTGAKEARATHSLVV